MRHQLDSRITEIERFIARATARDVPEELQSYLARFGAVLVCGFVERSVETIIVERLNRRAHERVLNFIRSHFKRGTNYDKDAIEQLLLRFDSNWYRNFRTFIESNQDVEVGISSLYGVRNSVAHGGTNSLEPKRLTELFDISKKLIEGLIKATE